MIKEALIKKLEGDIEVAKADLRLFLDKPIGVAEHIDYVITAEKKLDILVFSSNQTLIWDTLVNVGIKNKIKGFGKLLRSI